MVFDARGGVLSVGRYSFGLYIIASSGTEALGLAVEKIYFHLTCFLKSFIDVLISSRRHNHVFGTNEVPRLRSAEMLFLIAFLSVRL